RAWGDRAREEASLRGAHDDSARGGGCAAGVCGAQEASGGAWRGGGAAGAVDGGDRRVCGRGGGGGGEGGGWGGELWGGAVARPTQLGIVSRRWEGVPSNRRRPAVEAGRGRPAAEALRARRGGVPVLGGEPHARGLAMGGDPGRGPSSQSLLPRNPSYARNR